ncbi:MAG: winged helix-turn-helix domain-containing protein [Candidatus Hodarchaeota archaeon]
MQTPNVKVVKSPKSAQLVLQYIPAQILLLLSKNGEKTAYWLAKELKLPRQNILYYLKKLKEENLVYQTRTERRELGNKDLEKQFERKYYAVCWQAVMPTLKSLKQEHNLILEHELRFFIYGWLLGRNFSIKQIYRLLNVSSDERMREKKIEVELAEELESLFLEFEKTGRDTQSSIRQVTKDLEKDFNSLNVQMIDGEILKFLFLALAAEKVVTKRVKKYNLD